jgi:hypothetical protein
MNAELCPFDPADLAALECRPVHEKIKAAVLAHPTFKAAARLGYARTLVSETGRVVACAGILAGNDEAWAFIASDARRHTRSILRAAKDGLTAYGRPVYARVNGDDLPAVRLAEAIGFRPHRGVMWVYDPSSV